MRVVFIGTGSIAVPVLQTLLTSTEHEVAAVVTQPDRPAGRDQKLQPPPVKAALSGAAIPILQPVRIKAAEAVAEIRGFEPEVVVVMAYGQILPRAVLEIPKVACLNLHASLLPRHRGAAPVQAAIVAGDGETGISVMYMDEGLDTGDVLLQSAVRILPNETGGSLHDRLAEIAPAALLEALARLHAGDAARIPQDSGLATYAPKLQRDDGKIDWTEPAAVIERKIRAFDPWPGAFMILTDPAGRALKLKIFSGSVSNERLGEPGATALVENQLAIGCGEGSLIPADVQIEGKRRMSARELLQGRLWIASATNQT